MSSPSIFSNLSRISGPLRVGAVVAAGVLTLGAAGSQGSGSNGSGFVAKAASITPSAQAPVVSKPVAPIVKTDVEVVQAETVEVPAAVEQVVRMAPARRLAIYGTTDLNSILGRIKACESGGNYAAVSRSGKYRGAYQFDYRTWQSVGGTGDPAAASPAEQDQRAQMLYNQRGGNPWPVCSRR